MVFLKNLPTAELGGIMVFLWMSIDITGLTNVFCYFNCGNTLMDWFVEIDIFSFVHRILGKHGGIGKRFSIIIV